MARWITFADGRVVHQQGVVGEELSHQAIATCTDAGTFEAKTRWPNHDVRSRVISIFASQMVSTEFLTRVEQLPLVWSSEPGSFARLGFTSRYPALVRDSVELNGERFPEEQRRRLLRLADELEHDAEIPLPSALNVYWGPTTGKWEKLLTGRVYRWHKAPWFLAGMYMFHLILLLTGYYRTGVDPFHASYVVVP
ncbi:unnamed protein product [Phytophthora lilii]|uniref:Unnamed protein product n=1 Tax=Phytophthora lilii TaxID=2077276 RepID=A0A9W6UEH0_9STRA|nr:unnamed protein product [Phytophthora lilii]